MLVLTPLSLACATAAWEALYQASGLVLRFATRRPGVVLDADGASQEKLGDLGASYAGSFVHALIVTSRGLMHLIQLAHAPIEAKLMIPADPADPWHAAAVTVEATSVIFLSYLLYDVVHVVLALARGDRRLGGLDTLAHHLGFITAASICGPCRALPFAFGWLIVGEFSSVFLNVRWFLVTSGRGASALLRTTNVLFAVSFFLGRIVVRYAHLPPTTHICPRLACISDERLSCCTQVCMFGFVHLFIHRETMFATPGLCCSRPLLKLVLGMLVPAYCLNLVWMGKIVSMVRGGAAKKKT